MSLSSISSLLKISSCNQREKKTIFKTIRLVVYFFILLFLVFGLWAATKLYGNFIFSELGPVENFQLAILLITSFIFLKDAINNKTYRPLLFFLGSLTLFAVVREQDHFFEELIPVISWKFAWLFPILSTGYILKKRKNFLKILLLFLDSNVFQLMFMAMIIFIPLAQCIGHRSFIVNAIGSSKNIIEVRRLIEETMELISYILIFLSAFEMHWEFLKQKKRKK